MDTGDLTYILETEKHFLDIISDCHIGEASFDSMAAIQNECMSRLRKKYTDSEIEELKNRLPKNYRPPSKSETEIHEELLEFLKIVLIPKAKFVRKQIIQHLPENVRGNIKDLYTNLKTDIDLHFRDLKILIEKQIDVSESNKLKELARLKRKEELSNVISSMSGVLSRDNSNYVQLREVAKGLVESYIPFEVELNKLFKKRYQIILGRIGNFLMMGFKNEKNKDEIRINSITELLIIGD